jgi:serine/threonine-protein kinase
VEDLESRNGTWINHQRITSGVLRRDDMLKIGLTQFFIEEPAEPDPLEGKRFGNFELQEALGTGSYGRVYKALQINLARPVAVKILNDECSQDPERVNAFLVEARRAGRLNHPNLVQVHDVLEMDGRYLLVMELMSGCTTDLLRDDGLFSESQLVGVIRDMCRALAYAESQRLVHRDVKPDNILVSEEGVYKLADLGIAAPISADGHARQERIFGSPHYVAPEQARGGMIDGRADLYALGASAWHLATGATLFTGTSRQLVGHHLNSAIPDLRKLAPKLSSQVVAFITNLLDKDPSRRPVNAAEALKRIEQIHLQNAVKMITPFPRRRVPVRRFSRRMR